MPWRPHSPRLGFCSGKRRKPPCGSRVMRIRTSVIPLAAALSMLALGTALAQKAAPRTSGASMPAAKPAPPAPPPAPAKPACANPNALGVSRVVAIDTTGGPGFGFEHFKQLDFLREKEVVLTFADGPWPANLNNKKLTDEQRKAEIEKGISAVKWALGEAPAPFIRFPALQHPPSMVAYMGERNIAIWSCDADSFDFKASTPKKVIDTVMGKLDKLGKGIILMHDFQKHTAEALPELLKRLKEGGYKVVQVKAKTKLQSIAQYDEEVVKGLKQPTVNSRPVSSVVETISQ